VGLGRSTGSFVGEADAKAQTGATRIRAQTVPPGQLGHEAEQPVRVGRRWAAIVAADLAGYSRLIDRAKGHVTTRHCLRYEGAI
jgi:hypothetical protein